MTSERWQEVKEVLHGALLLHGAERLSWLSEACKEDASLRLEVESLLEQEDALGGFIADPLFELHGESPAEADPDQKIGPYRILRELGRGGMGAVYLAEREGDFRKEVALKVLKRGMDTDEIVRRFHNERQILAGLEHPNIAHLLDGGSTEQGLPYLVLEYVEGERIDRWCDREKLSVEARLRLFLEVCDAVHKAHQSLVVHRDLKPGNILITAEGRPKLLDFGIAKLLGPGRSELTELAPGGRAAPLTPGYASPEQIRGEAVTTASDVYSLGVLLYVLLSGHRPYRLRAGGRAELEAAILEQEPLRPSTAVARSEETRTSRDRVLIVGPEAVSSTRAATPRRLRRSLRGDLDWIVLKALAKDPAARYGSVEQLAEDIRRNLGRQPVLARGPSPAYLLGKFVRRNRLWLAAAAAVLLVAGGLLWRELQQARLRGQLLATFQTVINSKDPFELRTLISQESAADKLRRAAAAISEAHLIRDTERSSLLMTVGKALVDHGEMAEAEEVLAEALALAEAHSAADPLEIAETHEILARLYSRDGKSDLAERHFRRVLEIYEKDDRTESRRGVLVVRNELAQAYADQARWEEVEQLQIAPLDDFRGEFGDDHPYVALAANNLAVYERRRGQLEEAERLLLEALEVWDRSRAFEHPERARTLQNLGGIYVLQKKLAEAEPLLGEALAIQEKILPADHPLIALTLNNLAQIAIEKGDYAAAEPLLLRAVAIGEAKLRPGHPRLGVYRVRLAQVLSVGRHFEEALLLYEAGLEAARESPNVDPEERAKQHAGYAFTLLQTGHLERAETEQSRVAEVRRERLAENPTDSERHLDLAITLFHLGNALARQNKCGEIDPVLGEAAQALVRSPEAERWRSFEIEGIRGECLRHAGRFAEAEGLLSRSLQALLAAKPGDWRVPEAKERLFDLYQAWGKPEQARPYSAALAGV